MGTPVTERRGVGRGWWRACAAVLVAACLGMPAAVLAQASSCGIVANPPTFQEGEPNQVLNFSFDVVTVGTGTCTSASGTIAVTFGNGTVSDATFTSGPGTVSFTLTLPSQRGDGTGVQAQCTNCDPGSSQAFFDGYVRNLWSIEFVDPPSGNLQAVPNSQVNLQVQLLLNGAPADSGEDSVCWQLVSNPAGDAALGPGDFSCEAAPASAAKGLVIGGGTGTFIPGGANGVATIALDVGSASLDPVEVVVSPSQDPMVMASIKVATVPTLQAVTSSPITVDTGTSFPVEVQTLDINGGPSPGKQIVFASTAAPEISGGATVPTDGNGSAITNFVANAAGSYPGAITATYDPTPASPGSGDEQTVVFAVEVNDVVALSKPASGSGDNQVATVNQPFAEPLAALVTRNGSPSPGESVGWQVVSGAAELASTSSSTGSDGLATNTVTAGPTTGPIQVRAFLLSDPSQETFYTLTAESVRTLRMPSTGSGNLQSGTPGATLNPLVAQAFDDGAPAPGVAVNWTVLSGAAMLGASQTVTDSNGNAQVPVTLGSTTGPVQVQASRVDEPTASVIYELNVVDVERLTIVSGADQQPLAGTEGDPLVVRFTRNGVPVQGVTVQWTVTSGDATVAPATSTTDGQGLASTVPGFGDDGGSVVIQASAGNAQPQQFSFTVSGGSGPPPEGLVLTMVSGDDQRGAPGSRAEQPLVVQVSDGDGEPLAGVLVNWRLLSGTAQLDASDVRTGEDGRAALGFRFAQVPGAIEIRASVFSDVSVVDFDAEAFAPSISIVSGDGQQGEPGQPLPEDFVVAIAEPVLAKALEGTQVSWTLIEGDGTLASPTTTTDAQGQARNRLTLGSSTGTYRVRAQVPGGAHVEFTAVAGSEGELAPVSGDAQTLPTQTLSEPLVVELRDAAGNPVQGATLTWSGDNAEPEAETTTTDAQGRSSNRVRVVLPGAASVTVTAQDLDVEPVVFAINGGVINTEGLAPNQVEVADAIDQLCPALAALENRSAEQDDLLARCLELVENSGDNPDLVADALEEMLQDVALTQVNAALLTASAQFDNLKARIAALRSGARGFSIAGLNVAGAGGVLPLSLLQADGEDAEVGADFGRWGFFASGTVGRGEVDAGAATPEYDFDTAGLTAGVDYRVSDRWIVGAAAGFSRQDTEVAGERGKVDTDGWSMSAYTTWFNEDSWYLDGVLTWGSNDYELERRIRYTITAPDGSVTSVDQLASADSDGSQLAAAVSFGRDFQRGAWNIGPYFRGTWTRVEFDDYTEQLIANLPGSGLGLSVEARDVTSATAVLGGKLTYTASRDWGILMPHVNVEWEHEFKDDPQNIVMRFLHDPTQTPIALQGDALDTDYFNVGIGLSALFPGGKSGFLYYEHLVGASGISQGNLAIGVRIEF